MRGYGSLDRGQYDTPGELQYATGCALLVDAGVFETAGLLDESYFMYHEDYAFCDQARAHGFALWYEPGAVVRHRVSASTGEGSPQKWRFWGQAAVLFYRQHYRLRVQAGLSLAAFLMWVAVRESVKGRRGWLGPLARGVAAGLADRGGQDSRRE